MATTEVEELYEKREQLMERHQNGEDVWDELQEVEDRITEEMMNGNVH